MLTLRVVEARNLEPVRDPPRVCPPAAPRDAAPPPPSQVVLKGRRDRRERDLSSFVTIHHGSQSKMTHRTSETPLNPKWDSVVEFWDSEMCETLEFVVVIRAAGGTLWKHSMATVNMEQFRAAPETKIEVALPLGSLTSRSQGSKTAAAAARPEPEPAAAPAEEERSFGELILVGTYTEDCVQPTFLQSVFCNVLFCPASSYLAPAQRRNLPRAVPRAAPALAPPQRQRSSLQHQQAMAQAA